MKNSACCVLGHILGRLLTAAVLGAASLPVAAGEVQVAVASNFAAPMQRLAADFARASGHTAVLAFGASGSLYAQVRHGAPFELLLSADEAVPARLQADGLAVTGSRFTYAVGRLVLWSADPDRVAGDGAALLRAARFERLALANPKLAPYGAAAVQAMTRLGVLEALRPRFVQGENIAQTHQFVASGNAALGFVALSQVQRAGRLTSGSGWVVPAELHAPIRQDAVLLARGADNPAATALLAYLRSDAARATITGFGYEAPAAPPAGGPR